MSDQPNSNKQARINGSESEFIARHVLENRGFKVEYLNGIFDFLLNGKYILEVKSCQRHITDNTHTNGLRRGRYIFNRTQHDYLQQHNGVYLFLLHTANWYSDLRLIPATALSYKRQRPWPAIFNNTHTTEINQSTKFFQTIFSNIEVSEW